MVITPSNYEQIKQQLEDYEKEQEEQLEYKRKREEKIALFEKFKQKIPKHLGYLCYPTKVIVSIDYKVATPNYQGVESKHTSVELPLEIYDELLCAPMESIFPNIHLFPRWESTFYSEDDNTALNEKEEH